MLEVERELRRSSIPIPLLKAGYLEKAAGNCAHSGFGYLQEWRPLSLCGHPVPVCDHPHKKLFSYLLMEFSVF